MRATGQAFPYSENPKYLAQEILRIWQRLGRPIEPAGINLTTVAGAIGQQLDSGQIRALRAFLEGKEIATQIVTINEAANGFALYAAKPTIAGNVNPVVQVDINDPQVEGLRVAQAGDGYGVYLDGCRGAAYALLYLKANSGAAPYIHTDNNAQLTAAGVWTDACSWRRKRYVFMPSPSWALKRIRGLKVATWTPRRGSGKERHISPSAEAFGRSFRLGESNGLSALDLAGAGILGIQALLRRVETLEAEVKRLKGT